MTAARAVRPCCVRLRGHFATLLRTMPERYAYHEQQEEALRAELGPAAAVLREWRGDDRARPLTLRQLRMRLEAGQQCNMFDIGGCGCFIDEAPTL